MVKYIIYLEGNISSGKSTLIPRLSNKLKTLLCNTNIYEYVEPLHIWNDIKKCDKPILQLLYEHPHQFAPTFQYLTLITRQSQYIEFLEKKEGIALIERSYLSDRLFQNVMHSEGYIDKLHMDIFKTAHIPTIKHIHIYVRTDPNFYYERIHLHRKRPEKQNINILYLEKLHKMHDDIFLRDDIICLDNNEELTEDKLNVLCINIIQMLND